MEQSLSPVQPSPDADPAGGPGGAYARLLATLRGLGPARLALLGGVGLGLLGFFAYLVLDLVEPRYGLLYSDLGLEDSAEIVGRLEAMEVPYRLREDGATILVPAAQALRLRMALAEDGLPQGGSVGYEIFDQTSAFGTTDFLANVNLRRALEGELARTITAISGVRSARVHLVMPERELFRRDQTEPSASITLRMQGAGRLTRRQVLAVQHLSAAAVPNLSPERITIVDDQGTLLARGGDGAGSGIPTQAEELRAAYEQRLKHTIEQLLERSLGAGRVRAEVAAELDFDRITTTEERYDPESQVVRSTQLVEEESEAAERDRDDAVTVGNNLPNAGADAEAAGRSSSENRERTEETINYEISRTVRNTTQAGGRVQRLSVAVLVDGKMVPDGSGEAVYTERPPEELEQIATLVRSAIGFDAARGDVVEVINMPFSDPPAMPAEGGWFDFGKHDLMRLTELAVLALIGLLLITLVLRPAVRHLLVPPTPALAGAGAAGEPASLPASGEPPALTGPAEDADDDAERVDVKLVAGPIRADLVEQIHGAIEQAPDDVVAIIRGWLNEG